MAQRGSPDAILPSAETIGAKLNALDSYPQKVATHQPPKKLPETDAIFAQATMVNQVADAADTVLRIARMPRRSSKSVRFPGPLFEPNRRIHGFTHWCQLSAT